MGIPMIEMTAEEMETRLRRSARDANGASYGILLVEVGGVGGDGGTVVNHRIDTSFGLAVKRPLSNLEASTLRDGCAVDWIVVEKEE